MYKVVLIKRHKNDIRSTPIKSFGHEIKCIMRSISYEVN